MRTFFCRRPGFHVSQLAFGLVSCVFCIWKLKWFSCTRFTNPQKIDCEQLGAWWAWGLSYERPEKMKGRVFHSQFSHLERSLLNPFKPSGLFWIVKLQFQRCHLVEETAWTSTRSSAQTTLWDTGALSQGATRRLWSNMTGCPSGQKSENWWPPPQIIQFLVFVWGFWCSKYQFQTCLGREEVACNKRIGPPGSRWDLLVSYQETMQFLCWSCWPVDEASPNPTAWHRQSERQSDAFLQEEDSTVEVMSFSRV